MVGVFYLAEQEAELSSHHNESGPGSMWCCLDLGCAEKCLLKRTPKGEGVLLEEIQLHVHKAWNDRFLAGTRCKHDAKVDYKVSLKISVEVLLL